MDRRRFIALSGALAATSALPAIAEAKLNTINLPVKAILFDGFPIFDPRPVFKMALQFFPEKGNELVKEWRTRQFEYTWLRTLTGDYRDFFKVTEDALVFAGMLLGVNMSSIQQTQLMEAYYHLSIWPEVAPALSRLKAAGFRLGILSNFTPKMLTVNAANNHIDHYFENLISTDILKKYKPDPATYALGMSTFNLSKEEILFVPFGGWDAAGAKTFGYQTYWINGMQLPPEQLDAEPDGAGKTLDDLLAYLHI